MNIRIVYASDKYFKSFHETLGAVAREKVYIEMVEAPDLHKVAEFQSNLIARDYPVFYALDGERVIGWCDISRHENPRQSHRAVLGMGILEGYRRKGIGSQLMSAALGHAKKLGVEKVELNVYSSNVNAHALYKKFGFAEEGTIKNYRKVDGRYFDAIMMSKFL